MSRGEPIRVRRAVLHRGQHIGYVTEVSYPHRDLTAFSQGTPYREVVIAGLGEQHVALIQRYKEHWLIQCGACYVTTDGSGELSSAAVMRLARIVLAHTGHPPALQAEQIRKRIEGSRSKG
jgi:hypothetical protein